MQGMRRVVLPSLVTVLAVFALASGCSEPETIVSVIELDFVAEIPATEVQAIELRDPERPLDQAEVLHLGTTGIEAGPC